MPYFEKFQAAAKPKLCRTYFQVNMHRGLHLWSEALERWFLFPHLLFISLLYCEGKKSQIKAAILSTPTRP